MTLSEDGKTVYLFGGANSDGPLKDLYQLELETLLFKKIKIDDDSSKLPSLEMHFAELYKKTNLLVIGGRGLFAG